MTRPAIRRAYTKAELLAVPDVEILEHFPTLTKTLAFDENWSSWALKQSADLVELCDAHRKGRRVDELVRVNGKMRGLADEARYIWRHLVKRSMGYQVAGVDRVIPWRARPFTWASDEHWDRVEALERAELA